LANDRYAAPAYGHPFPLPNKAFGIIGESQTAGFTRPFAQLYQYESNTSWINVASADALRSIATTGLPICIETSRDGTVYFATIQPYNMNEAGDYRVEIEAFEDETFHKLIVNGQCIVRYLPAGPIDNGGTDTTPTSIQICPMKNRKLIICVANSQDSDKGYFVVLQMPYFKTSYVDANTIRIYNYTGKTQAVRASCVS
jgi:hypothetical protein